jgi:hypothetical protein
MPGPIDRLSIFCAKQKAAVARKNPKKNDILRILQFWATDNNSLTSPL